MERSRFINKRIILNAPLKRVWDLWTTEKGLKDFFAPNCNFKFEIGEPFEMLFDSEQPYGFQGSEGCKIMAIEPMALLSFSWNAPPHMSEVRKQRTFVEVRFEKGHENTTVVNLNHYGWGISEEWTTAYNYFDRAWDFVFSALKGVCDNPENGKSTRTSCCD